MNTAPGIPLEYHAGTMRDFAFPVVSALLLSFAPFSFVIALTVVLGQSHFAMAYLYQYKGKKMNAQYLLAAAVLGVVGVAYFSLGIGTLPLLAVAATLFAAHFALDEFTLHGEPLTRASIVTIALFASLHLAFLLSVIYPSLTLVSVVVAVLLCLFALVRIVFHQGRIASAERYLWYVGTILCFLAFVAQMPGQVLGVILLLHFTNWYVGYGSRLAQKSRERALRYQREFAFMLFAALLLYGFYAYGKLSFLYVLFDLTYFYAWAALHIILSFMTATFRLAF